MNYGELKKTDIANGEGVRVSLFVSGCTHHCKGCFNEMTWDFSYGRPFTPDTENEIIAALSPNYVDGLTLLGGEPFEPSNQQALLPLLRRIHNEMPGKNIWAYSGYLWDRDIFPNDGRAHTDVTDELISYLDILVDGPFVEDQKSLMLVFRGSSNQRIIKVRETIRSGEVVLWEPPKKSIL